MSQVKSKLPTCNISSLLSNTRSYSMLCSNGTVATWGHGNSTRVTIQVEPKLVACNVTKIVSNTGSYAALCGNSRVVSWGLSYGKPAY